MLCVAIFGVLTVSSAVSDRRAAERYGEHVEVLYACENAGQDWLSEADAYLKGAGDLPENTEGIYDNRFKYVNELRKMGAEIQVDGRVAIIEGGARLTGAVVQACDLRAGAAMVIAGMCAAGTTVVEDIHFIERGYENFVGKLKALGAEIEVVDFPDDTDDADKIVCIS